ncbi:MAG: DUF5518 domain-containing protein [Halobacteriaceae archaeon]
MTDRSIYLDALVGAAVTVVLGFVPFSAVVGGGVAGYVHGRDGARVGALSGAFAAVPKAGLVVLALAFFLPVAPGAGARTLVLLAVVFVLFATYVVALAALGGYLGAALARRRRDADR